MSATATESRLPATLSLDLDDTWTYLRAAGRDGWEQATSLVPLVCQRLLAMLDATGLRITLFVVAQDLRHPDRVAAIRPFVERGHEIGCHSMSHDPWFATLPFPVMREQVLTAADLIEQELGVRPRGFRAPGFAWSDHLPAILREGGFSYDASPLPTFLGPLCRLYYFLNSGMSKEERKRRAAMYGGFGDMLRSNRPGRHAGEPPLQSLPVTTFPMFRTPFHMSYVVWLARRSRGLALAYLKAGLLFCRLFANPPSYLLHSLDYVGQGDCRELDFFPGMDMSWERKRDLLQETVGTLASKFRVLPLLAFVRERAAT